MDNIRIFGSEFVKNNKKICKMIIDNEEYEISEKYYPKFSKFKLEKLYKNPLEKILNYDFSLSQDENGKYRFLNSSIFEIFMFSIILSFIFLFSLLYLI